MPDGKEKQAEAPEVLSDKERLKQMEAHRRDEESYSDKTGSAEEALLKRREELDGLERFKGKKEDIDRVRSDIRILEETVRFFQRGQIQARADIKRLHPEEPDPENEITENEAPDHQLDEEELELDILNYEAQVLLIDKAVLEDYKVKLKETKARGREILTAAEGRKFTPEERAEILKLKRQVRLQESNIRIAEKLKEFYKKKKGEAEAQLRKMKGEVQEQEEKPEEEARMEELAEQMPETQEEATERTQKALEEAEQKAEKLSDKIQKKEGKLAPNHPLMVSWQRDLQKAQADVQYYQARLQQIEQGFIEEPQMPVVPDDFRPFIPPDDLDEPMKKPEDFEDLDSPSPPGFRERLLLGATERELRRLNWQRREQVRQRSYYGRLYVSLRDSSDPNEGPAFAAAQRARLHSKADFTFSRKQKERLEARIKQLEQELERIEEQEDQPLEPDLPEPPLEPSPPEDPPPIPDEPGPAEKPKDPDDPESQQETPEQTEEREKNERMQQTIAEMQKQAKAGKFIEPAHHFRVHDELPGQEVYQDWSPEQMQQWTTHFADGFYPLGELIKTNDQFALEWGDFSSPEQSFAILRVLGSTRRVDLSDPAKITELGVDIEAANYNLVQFQLTFGHRFGLDIFQSPQSVPNALRKLYEDYPGVRIEEGENKIDIIFPQRVELTIENGFEILLYDPAHIVSGYRADEFLGPHESLHDSHESWYKNMQNDYLGIRNLEQIGQKWMDIRDPEGARRNVVDALTMRLGTLDQELLDRFIIRLEPSDQKLEHISESNATVTKIVIEYGETEAAITGTLVLVDQQEITDLKRQKRGTRGIPGSLMFHGMQFAGNPPEDRWTSPTTPLYYIKGILKDEEGRYPVETREIDGRTVTGKVSETLNIIVTDDEILALD